MIKKNKQIFAITLTLVISLFLLGSVDAFIPEEGCNLQLTKYLDKTSPIIPGEKIIFTLVYENIGESNCTGAGVKIEEVLDENLFYEGNYSVEILNDSDGEGIYYGWQETPGFEEITNTLTWNAHSVSPGEKGIITIEVEAMDKGECENYTITNFFRAWSDQEYWKESNSVNLSVEDECEEECECPPCECPCGGCYIDNCDYCDDGCEDEPQNDEEEEEECDNGCKDKSKSKRIAEFCEPNWVCSSWGECVNGFMTRSCTDTNNCDADYGRPYEQTSCIEKAISTAYVLDNSSKGINIWVVMGIMTAIALLIILIILIG